MITTTCFGFSEEPSSKKLFCVKLCLVLFKFDKKKRPSVNIESSQSFYSTYRKKFSLHKWYYYCCCVNLQPTNYYWVYIIGDYFCIRATECHTFLFLGNFFQTVKFFHYRTKLMIFYMPGMHRVKIAYH